MHGPLLVARGEQRVGSRARQAHLRAALLRRLALAVEGQHGHVAAAPARRTLAGLLARARAERLLALEARRRQPLAAPFLVARLADLRAQRGCTDEVAGDDHTAEYEPDLGPGLHENG